MELNEIKEFLRNKPGYLKEGKRRLRDILRSRGFSTTLHTCSQAIREVNSELRISPFIGKEPKILFYDIEVSYGLARAWRPGYKVRLAYDDFEKHPKIICISWKWNTSDEVFTAEWDANQEDKELLEVFIPELNKADFIVAHNGDNFDLPWIRTRALSHGLAMYPTYNSVDTLKVARYDHKLPSNRLDDIGDYFGLGRKIKTDRQLWVDVCTNHSPVALLKMMEYCEQDVLLLEKIYNKFAAFTQPKVHVGVLNGENKQTSPYTGTTNIAHVKTTTTKAGTIRHTMKCLDTEKYFLMSNMDYNKYKLINES